MLKNWKTTIGGLLSAGAHFIPVQLPIQQIIQSIGLLLLGASAQDTIKLK
jgi:hypothetical protein